MKPIVCNYYLTLRCNARCSFCDLWQHADAPLADSDIVLRNIRQLRSAGVRIIDFTGGEPLLHPDLPLFLEEAKRHHLKTTVTTNGLLYPKQAQSLIGLIDLFHISIDGADAEMHNRLRGIDCYDKAIESIELALSLGEQSDLLFTANSDNYSDIVPVAEYASSKGLILIVNPVFEACGGKGILNREQLLEIENLCHRPNVYLNGGVIQIMKDGGVNISDPRCYAVSSTIVISPENGLLLPCFHNYNTSIPIGDDLSVALAAANRQEALRMQGKYSFCEGCTINCYLAPSLPFRFDRYFVKFLPWAAKYIFYRQLMKIKHLWVK